LQTEFLNPLIDRVFNVMMRRGLFAQVPEELSKGVNLVVEYVSPVARAQRMTQVMGFQRMLESLSQLAQTGKPDVFDRVDGDEVVSMYAEAYDVDRKVLKSQELVDKERAQRQEQAQKDADAQRENMESNTLSNVSKSAQATAQANATQQPGVANAQA
jgi:hypothetical protein